MLYIYVASHLWKDLDLCGCLVLHCFLEANSIYSSIIEAKEMEQVIMKVKSIDVFAFLCLFAFLYYTFETCKPCALAKKKDVYIDLTVEAYEEYSEISFFEWRSPSEFNNGHSL